ncbi:MAG: hypothetical protein AAB416_01190 [Patescibacteria group bacterium]
MSPNTDSSGSDDGQTTNAPRTRYRVPTGEFHNRVDAILDASPTIRPTVKMSRAEREGILSKIGTAVRSLLPSGNDG